MKRMVFLTVLSLLLAGCSKQQPTQFSGIEAGLLKAGVFTTDNGTTMHIDGNEGGYDLLTARRVLVSYQTHPIADPSDVTIDLLGLWDAVMPEPVPEEGVEQEPDAPVHITEDWFNAGYLNILATHAGDPVFTASYFVNGGGITLRLRRDGMPGEDSVSTFLSIPMTDAVVAYDRFRTSMGREDLEGEIPVTLVWSWYRQTTDGPSQEVILYEKKGSFTRFH